jgi:hypothetical protein
VWTRLNDNRTTAWNSQVEQYQAEQEKVDMLFYSIRNAWFDPLKRNEEFNTALIEDGLVGP